MTQSSQRRHTHLLDPKLDLVFSKLFGAEQNRSLLIGLLNAVLQPPQPIVSVELLPTHDQALEVDGKPIALDLRARLEGGEQIDVEMQTRGHPALRERGLFYWGRLYTGQLQRGTPYPELRRCVVIFITDFVELEGERFHSIFQARERHGGELLTDHLELHFVELPKLPALWASFEGSDEPSLLAWCRFLSASEDEELELLAEQDPILKQAKQALEQLSADPAVRLQAEHREMSLQMWEAGMAKVRRESMDEGRDEGRVEGKVALLLRVLALKFGPLSPETVQKVRMASEASLDSWSERFVSATALSDVFAQQ
jgi:predicted transposase/invertase (TIGR01784 family)